MSVRGGARHAARFCCEHVSPSPLGARLPRGQTPGSKEDTYTVGARLLKPAPPSSRSKAVHLNISFLQSEFTFKVQSANTMCFCFGFFNCFLVRVSHTSRKGPAASAPYPCFLGWKRKDRNRGVVNRVAFLVRGDKRRFLGVEGAAGLIIGCCDY